MTKALSYLSASSLTDVGSDKDADKRQRDKITAYARAHDIEIVAEFYDAGTRRAEPGYNRPGFSAMLDRIAENGIRMILVENASRFARDLIVQETGYLYLQNLGITLIAVDDPDSFTADTPTAQLIRQVLGTVAEFEKANLVAKLKRARDCKRAKTGRCEGRKPAPEAARTLAKQMHMAGATLRLIASALAEKGFLSPSGKPYYPASIQAMLR